MLDKYFKRPLIWDYSFATVFLMLVMFLHFKHYFNIPKDDHIFSTTSDLCNVGFTLTGFILTLLTVLITFKSSSKINKNTEVETESVFDLFFATGLYYETVKHLKNCVKSLIFVSVIGYFLKIILSENNFQYLHFFNVFGLIIIVLTMIRSLLILTKIIHLQKNDVDDI